MINDERDTLPLIPIREETGLLPPPESAVRPVREADLDVAISRGSSTCSCSRAPDPSS